MCTPRYTYRAQCGTRDGLIAHGVAGEAQCPVCARLETALALEAERLRPTPPARLEPLAPLTLERIAANRRALEQLAAEDEDTARASRTRPPLTVVPSRRRGAA